MPESEGTQPESWEYSLYIPNDPRAVTVCRRTLRLILTMHGLIGLVDVAELLATELVSNAVRHTKGPAALRVRWSAGVLRIGAWDADPQPPQPPQELGQLTESEDGGHGLGMVRACSDLWGWQPLSRFGNRGKFVW
jgi:anti-sigma regulatory factor (Ser/Thr protein kinase)